MAIKSEGIKKFMGSIKKPIVLPLVGAAIVIFVLVAATYVEKKEAFEEASSGTEVYTNNASLDVNQGIVVKTTDESGEEKIVTAESILDEFNYFEDYLEDDANSTKVEKLQYLMNAELVTKFPYINDLASDESKLNGVVRFYRYTNEIEAQEGEQEDWDWEEVGEGQDSTPGSRVEVDLSKIFYIGDSWMEGLDEYIENYAQHEYPGADHFLCKVGAGPRDGTFSNENLKTSIDAVSPSTIVIMLGLNDRSKGASDRMAEIIQFLADTYPDKTIYILKVPHVGKEYKYSNDFDATKMNQEIDEYNPILLQYCSSKANTKYIDTTADLIKDGFLDEQYCTEDGLHLQNNGKALWYQNIKESTYLGRSSISVGKFQMKYVNETDFQKMFDEYERSGNKEVYKYFTIDEENNVVVAYGTKTTRTVTTDDPEVTLDVVNKKSSEVYGGNDGTYSTVKYTASKKKIDYNSLIEPYVMPFNLLSAFLVQTQDYEFTAKIAKLAYESKICVGIYDNKSITVKNDSYNYNKSIKYSENTELNFKNIQGSDPEININDSKYDSVQRQCYTVSINGSNVHHSKEINNVSTNVREDGKIYNALVTEMSGDGIITGITEDLSGGYSFKTHYNKTIDANSNPSVGIVLADVWIGKWQVSYKQKDNNSNASSSEGQQEDEEYGVIVQNEAQANDRFSKELLAPEGAIGVKLTPHSERLKEDAIKGIADNTEFETSPRSMTVSDIRNCASGCDTCSAELEQRFDIGTHGQQSWHSGNVHYVTDDKLVEYVLDPQTNNLNHVYAHVNLLLDDEADTRNSQKIDDFKEYLGDHVTYEQWPTAQKANININFVTTNTRTSTMYEKDTTEMKDVGAKFKQIVNAPKHYDAKQAILRLSDWFWEYIAEAENTAKLENVIRYMFNIAFETNQFGTFTEEQIKELLAAFEPQELKNASVTGFKLLKAYLRTFENHAIAQYLKDERPYDDYVGRYITEDKTQYVVQNDYSAGFGVDIDNAGLEGDLETLGYNQNDWQPGCLLPVEVIDSFEDRILMENLENVRNATSSLNLTTYQIYALVMRTYNCGLSGATGSRNGYESFVDAYNKCYDQEKDDKYGELLPDFTNKLYTEYMSKPVTGENPQTGVVEYLPGLETRRKSEWTLFQTGYMDTLEMWVSGGGDILQAADEVHQQEMGWSYGTSGLAGTIEGALVNPNQVTCCATYVSCVLYVAGYVTEEEINAINYNYVPTVHAFYKSKGWEEINSYDDLEPGDIVITGDDDHVQIYAGDDTWYNAGSTEAIQNPAPQNQGNWARNGFSVAYRPSI